MDLMKRGDIPDSWNNLRSLQKEINSLFDDDFFPASTGLFDRSYSPSIDLVENADDFILTCELPGIAQNDIDVQVADMVLTIKGDKKESDEDSDRKWFKRESWYGSFQRTISLPAGVDAERITGEMENGVLRLILPKQEEVKPRQIAVKVK